MRFVARRNACDRALPHNGPALLGPAAAQAPIAQGLTCGISQYATQSCDHYSEEPVAQSGHGAFHRQRAHPHEATGEGKITGSRATGGNRVRARQKIGYVSPMNVTWSLHSPTMGSCVCLGNTTTQRRSVRRGIEKISENRLHTFQAIEKNKE